MPPGDLQTRVPVTGRDELSALAVSFNQMAQQLQAADQKQRELDILRRDLVAWASHDLQTPLTSMRAILEALSDGVVDEPEMVKRYLNTAQRDVMSLSALIDDLFQMSQLDAGGFPLNRAPSSLGDLVSDTLESFSELAYRESVKLEGHVEPGVDPVFMDTQAIGRVLNNLVATRCGIPPRGAQSKSGRGARAGVWKSACAIAVKASSRRTCRTSSSVFIAARNRATAAQAAPAWDWPSPRASYMHMGGTFGFKVNQAKVHSSHLPSRNTRLQGLRYENP